LGVVVSEPQEKLLACLDNGKGAMSEPQSIFDITARELLKDKFWDKKNVVITGGGSVEKLDDVRCLTNFSSGKMANSLAYAFYLKGAEVTLITSKPQNSLPVKTLYVKSSKEYEEAIKNNLSPNSYFIMAAAISDFIPSHVKNGKIKKEEVGDSWELELIKNEDILLNLDKQDIKTVGFKAEMDETTAQKSAKQMLEKKSLDAVCLNILKKENSFGSEKNEISFITKEAITKLPLADKFDISLKIVELTKAL